MWGKDKSLVFYCRQIITLGPDVILNIKIHKHFEESIGPLLPIERTVNTLIRLGGCTG